MNATPRRASIGVAYFAAAVSLAVVVWRLEADETLGIERLRWHGRENPLGIVQLEPELSWAISSNRRGDRQTAYQVLVASERRGLAPGRADLWDSGKVISAQQINVKYAGKSPPGRKQNYWTVRVWNKDD